MSRRIRLALVMNGGISLAVWMGGVAKELDLAMRAAQGRWDGVAEADRPQYEAWRKHLGGLGLEIDIVAGTSAGGLNGAILATSYGFGAPLPDLREMWATSASISENALLSGPTTTSILDGDFFERKAREVLETIRADGRSTESRSPVTLFVTSTTLGDHDRPYADSFDQTFAAPDHRRVYRFRSHPPSDEPNEFEKSFESLGLAARASAGFPVAFAPMAETAELLARAVGPHDRVDWLMDGGVLDNAPFGPVLDEIVTRPVDADVERVVVYVVPSDGGGIPRSCVPDRASTADRPPSWFAVLRAALSFPAEADFRDDLEELTRIFATADARRGAAAAALRSGVDPAVHADVRAALQAGSAFLRAQYTAQHAQYDEAAFLERIQGRAAQTVVLAPVLEQAPPTEAQEERPGPIPYGHSATERMVRNLLADLRERIREDGSAAAFTGGAAGVSTALRTLVQLREGIEDAVAARARAADDVDVRRLVADALAQGADARRSAFVDAVHAYAAATGASPAVVEESVTAVEIVSQALAPEIRPAPPPFHLLRLGPDSDCPLAPDARAVGDRKLYGTRLGHFGAFGRREWRLWDWSWGRMDAAAQLGRVLRLDDDAVRDLQQGIWTLEGEGDLAAATVAVAALPDDQLRKAFGRATVDGLLDSTARMLGAEVADLPALVRRVAPKVAVMMQTRWSIHPLWLFPGALVRRRIRSFFGSRR